MKNKGSVSAGLLIILLLIAIAIVAVTATISSDSAQEIKAQYIEGTAVVNGGESYLNLDYNQAIDENYNQLVARGVVDGRYSTIGRNAADGPDGPDDPDGPVDPPTPTPTPSGPVSDDDFRPQAMAVANTFKSTTFSFSKASVPHSADSNGRYFNYSQGAGSYMFPEYGGLSLGRNTDHRDCSCFCDAMLVLCGLRSSWQHFYSGTISGAGTEISISVMGDLQPGDLLVNPGSHVAMVVYKDSQYIYVGDFGSASTSNYDERYTVGLNGDKTAAQGWSYRYSLSTPWANGRQDKVEGGYTKYKKVVRP